MYYLQLKNKLKIHKYAILNFKYFAKKTTGQWTDTSVQGDQMVKKNSKISHFSKWNTNYMENITIVNKHIKIHK